jgi:hypothetical protein
MLRKLFFASFLAINLVFSIPALAAESTLAPEFNPLCWKEAKCNAMRRQLVGTVPGVDSQSVGNGFVSGDSAYPCIGDADSSEGPWGKCLPANVAKTEIAFGGVNQFANIGDFIEKNYRFAIAMIGVLAAVVVVISGFQWSMSGGNAETISSAKGRIVNSVIGMFIAYTSYFILNTINPNLVNLRLPQTWMLRPLESMPRFCSYAKAGSQFQEATKDQNQQKVELPTNPTYPLAYSQMTGDNATPNCGTRYFIKDGGTFTCYGDYCGSGQICSNFDPADPNRKDYHCIRNSIVGEITGNYLVPPICVAGNVSDFFSGYQHPWVVQGTDADKIFKVCVRDGGADTVSGAMLYPLNATLNVSTIQEPTNANPGKSGFAFSGISTFDESCPDPDQKGEFFYGYVIGMTLDRNCTTNDDVVIDRYGNLLGKLNNNGGSTRWISGKRTITDRDVFSAQELQRGQRLIIDVAQFKPQ